MGFIFGKIRNKIIILSSVIIASTMLIMTIVSYQTVVRTMKNRLINYEMPANVENILGEVEKNILKPLSGLSVIAEDPFLQKWMETEDTEGLKLLSERLGKNVQRFNTIGSNLVVDSSRNYYMFSKGQFQPVSKVSQGENDKWYDAFKDGGKASVINVYTNHTVFGEVAFINVRVDKNGNFLGLVSAALNLKDFVSSVINRRMGKLGANFMVDKNGVVQLHENKALLNTANISSFSGYANEAKNILKSESYNFQYNDKERGTVLVQSKLIPELNLYLVTEASMTELLSGARNAILIAMLVIGAILGSFFVVTSAVISSYIVRPLINVTKLLGEIAQGGGDLTRRLHVNTRDELRELADKFNLFVERLKEIIDSVKESADIVSNSSNGLTIMTDDLSLTVNEQALQISGIAAATEELKVTSDEVNRSLDSSRATMKETSQNTDQGMLLLNKAVDQVFSIKEKVDRLGDTISNLNNSSGEIGEILNVISDIADQTNLLALNAAIEAARAGEHGRGFAVVADEVRKLAERTQKATGEIEAIIKNLQGESSEAVKNMSGAQHQVEAGVDSMNSAKGAFSKILDSVNQMHEVNDIVSNALRETVTSITDINDNTQVISSGVEESSAALSEVSNTVAQQQETSDNLKQLVSQFKTK